MDDFFYQILIRLFRGVMALLGGLRVEGRENVPRTGPVLVVANHMCDLDPTVIALTLPRRAWYMAKQELFRNRIAAIVMRYLRAFPVKRDSPDRHALRFSENLLKSDRVLVIFPEGRGNPDGILGPFQPGAALLALRTKAPVVPAGIVGTPEVLPYRKLIPRRSKRPVVVRYGEPLDLDDLSADSRQGALEEATRRMEAAVAMLAEQPLPKHDAPEK